jgi:thiamine biosynthesis protein ThiS
MFLFVFIRAYLSFHFSVRISENNLMMQVRVNGEIREVPGELSLADLLEHLSMPSRLLAIELNKTVVRRKDWQDTTIKDADVIEIIHFVGGG